jgi:NADH:ubiquinone oxidoreductase subunit E
MCHLFDDALEDIQSKYSYLPKEALQTVAAQNRAIPG